MRLSGSSRTRRIPRSPEMPCRWFPRETPNPATGLVFTDVGAWEFIVEQLHLGVAVTPMTLDKPRGAIGYVMTIQYRSGEPEIYIKLQLGGGVVFGRSFHLSTR